MRPAKHLNRKRNSTHSFTPHFVTFPRLWRGCRGAGFTLIELLISVAILGFGLVIVIQSYLGVVGGLNLSQNYIEVMRFAKDKLTELEVAAFENKGLGESGPESGSQKLGTREVNWTMRAGGLTEPDSLGEDLLEICLKLNWEEQNKTRDAVLATYLPKKKEE